MGGISPELPLDQREEDGGSLVFETEPLEHEVTILGAPVGMLAVVAMADADTVKGELSFNSEGVGKVLECKSGRIFALGTMATNPYLRLVQRYWRASFHGKTPVLIEVGGVVTGASTPGTALTLESPNVVVLYGGRCSDYGQT